MWICWAQLLPGRNPAWFFLGMGSTSSLILFKSILLYKTKLPGCIFGMDVVLARRIFRRNSCCTPGLSAWQSRRLVFAESPDVWQLYCRKLGHTVPFARVFGNCLKVLQCRLPGVSTRLGLRRYIAKKSSGAAGPGLFARAYDKAAPETRLAKNPGFWH